MNREIFENGCERNRVGHVSVPAALENVRRACEAYKGTYREHVILQSSLIQLDKLLTLYEERQNVTGAKKHPPRTDDDGSGPDGDGDN